MIFGACKICREKDARIQELKAQVEVLSKLVSPPTSASRIPILALEADRVLSVADDVAELSPEQVKEFDRLESERTRILSGTY